MAALGSGLLSMPEAALAQSERIEITGSAIRRIDAESALPVLVLKREEIDRTGATSVVDLLQRLPALQGATNEAQSVGGNSDGFSGASIHNIGETRTLVLLNGHRLAQFGGQTLTGFAAGFDLNSIPISAIERVEVLTDGASALYGADAIAGVVNFITKRDTTDGDITLGFSSPSGGARETRISATKGFGSLGTEGFNAVFSVSHDERTKLDGTERDYAATGNLVFKANGKTYRSQQYSASAIPANVINDEGAVVSPWLLAGNPECVTNTFRVNDGFNDFCAYDFVSTLEIYPERKRDSFLGSATFRVGDHDLFADLLLSRTSQVSRIAGVPGGLPIPAGSEYHNTYLLPLGITESTTAFYRVADLGKRTSDDKASFYDVALGSKGIVAGWDYKATYTHSESKVEGSISGYPGGLALAGLRSSGLLNPFILPGEQSPEGNEALAAVNYKGYWDGGISKLDTFSLYGSTEVAKLPAGSMLLALGANYNIEKFQSKPSLFAQAKLSDPVGGILCAESGDPCDQRFGDAAAAVAYGADRKSTGLFAELNVPVVKGLEFTGSVRYDDYSDFGSNVSSKAAFRWVPMQGLLVRGSVGTGFHAPSVPQVKASPQSYGVTEDPYNCTADLQAVADSLNAECQPGLRQYDVVAGGNALLKPEKSRQASFGLRLEPTSNFSVGADFWYVAIKDAFGQLDEATVFREPLRFGGAWTTATDIVTGTTYLAWNAGNLNLGKSYNAGIDFDIVGRFATPIGDLTSQVVATYTGRDDYQLEQGGIYYSNLSNNEGNGVTFRWQGAWTNALKTQNWTHTLAINFKSGYKDGEAEVEVLDDTGAAVDVETIRLDVSRYVTYDWQSQWRIQKALTLTLGVLNVLDKDPPLSLVGSGGQQVGYDAAYYDPRGRTYYANLSYKF